MIKRIKDNFCFWGTSSERSGGLKKVGRDTDEDEFTLG